MINDNTTKANSYKFLVSRPSQRKIPCGWVAIIYYFIKNYFHIKDKCYIYSGHINV